MKKSKKRKGKTAAGAPKGSGKNFAALKAKFAAQGKRSPGGLAAYIGRKKYGNEEMAEMSRKGRMREEKE